MKGRSQRHPVITGFTDEGFRMVRMLLLIVLVAGGCSLGPKLSDHFVAQDVEPAIVHEGRGQSRLQVLVMYSGGVGSHTALRLIMADGETVFWDPAGDYGRFDHDSASPYGSFPEPVERSRDLLLINTPDLPTYVRFRWSLEDSVVEIFEWDITSKQALSLYQVLWNGTDDSHPAGSFSTFTFPPFCAMTTTNFLRRFANGTVHLSDWYFWPHNLANALSEQAPSRVYQYRRNGKRLLYIPRMAPTVRR